MTQVERIIAKVGTGKRLAELIGRDPSAISQMKKRGGLIPVRHHQQIIDGARQRFKVVITADDFFDPPSNLRGRKGRPQASAAE